MPPTRSAARLRPRALVAIACVTAAAGLAGPTTPAHAQQAAPAAETDDPVLPGLTSAEAWRLPDALVTKLSDGWQPRRQLYLDRGSVSIRANAMLLEIHALAALAGHTGAARQDDRIPGLVKLFTTAPVYVTKTRTKRSTGSFPHTPAWESVYRADSANAVLHPSADAIVARALATAWRARDVAGLPVEDAERIQATVGAVARGKFYDAPTRAENQINWNTDVYAANLEVNGDRSRLPDYARTCSGSSTTPSARPTAAGAATSPAATASGTCPSSRAAAPTRWRRSSTPTSSTPPSASTARP